jgi:hypothetical protein
MVDVLSELVFRGFFKAGRKDEMARIFEKHGFFCNVSNDELWIKNKGFSAIINDSSSAFMGESGFVNILPIKEEAYSRVYEGILSKKCFAKKGVNDFVVNHLNPLMLECFHDFKIDFGKLANNLEKLGINARFSNNVFGAWIGNASYSIDFNRKPFIDGCADDFFNLKDDDFFIGFPYCAINGKFNDFIFNGDLNDLGEISFKLIDCLADEFKPGFSRSHQIFHIHNQRL